MKKTYATSSKARGLTGWHKHLRKDGKRKANKGTRKLANMGIRGGMKKKWPLGFFKSIRVGDRRFFESEEDEVMRLLKLIVPDPEAAERWLDQPRDQFRGFSARDMMRKPSGVTEVLGFIRGIGHGNF